MQYTLAYLPVLGELGTRLVGHRLTCQSSHLHKEHTYTHTHSQVVLFRSLSFLVNNVGGQIVHLSFPPPLLTF